jgi:hypothetical protein
MRQSTERIKTLASSNMASLEGGAGSILALISNARMDLGDS